MHTSEKKTETKTEYLNRVKKEKKKAFLLLMVWFAGVLSAACGLATTMGYTLIMSGQIPILLRFTPFILGSALISTYLGFILIYEVGKEDSKRQS
jgi:fatty acid desaturase